MAKRPARRRPAHSPPEDELAIIHNQLARSTHSLGIVALRLVIMLAERIRLNGDNRLGYRFRVADYADRLGLAAKGSVYTQLQEVCDTLLMCIIETREQVGERIRFQVMSEARYYDDEGEVDLCFHEQMRPLLVSLQKYFSQIPLEVFFRIRSKHAARFYLFCKSWNPHKDPGRSWEMSVEQLHAWLKLKPGEYTKPSHLKDAVLKRAKKELDEVADVSFRYTEKRKGGAISGWTFKPVVNTPKRQRTSSRRRGLPAPAGPPPKPDMEPIARLWAEATEDQRQAWLADNFLRDTAPKDGEPLRPSFLARLQQLTRPAEAAKLCSLAGGAIRGPV